MNVHGMVIIGGGQAGARAVHTLREQGWNGKITLVCKEGCLPYERPPLSKRMLTEGRAQEYSIHDASYYAQNEVSVCLSTEAVAIDRKERLVRLSNGSSIPYQCLLLTTGAEPRKLPVPVAPGANLLYLRNAVQAAQLSQLLAQKKRCVVIGGGLIGLEVAASARFRGCNVCVIEAQPMLVGRAVPPQIAALLQERHTEAGVRFFMRSHVTHVAYSGGTTQAVLATGEALDCDVVVVGIGVAPAASLALSSGLVVNDGIVVDATLQTSDPAIYAAGDACRLTHPIFNTSMRQESWRNAEDQGRIAAFNMLGMKKIYTVVPWFWSEQYDLTLQVAGCPILASRVVRRGDPRSFILFHLNEDGYLVGVSGIGTQNTVARDVRLGQMLIEQRIRPEISDLQQPAAKLKRLLRSKEPQCATTLARGLEEAKPDHDSC